MREEVVLSAPVPPPVLRGPFTADQAVRDAMSAALAGDFAALDRLEVTYLNVLVRIGELVITDAEGRRHWWFVPQHERWQDARDRGLAPFVLAYHRRWGAACAPALEWALIPECRRCAGKLRRLACRVCGGDWYIDDRADRQLVYTSAEGVLLEEAHDEPAREPRREPEWEQGA